MASTTIRTFLVASIGASMLGCAPATPRWDREFGSSVRANLAAQTLAPAAGANANPAAGIDGPAARAAHDRYQRSYVQPQAEPAPALVAQ